MQLVKIRKIKNEKNKKGTMCLLSLFIALSLANVYCVANSFLYVFKLKDSRRLLDFQVRKNEMKFFEKRHFDKNSSAFFENFVPKPLC